MAEDEKTRLPKNGSVISIDVRCGQCYHFAKERANRYSDVCSKLGILAISRPCSVFTVDVNSISLKTEEGKDFKDILDKIPTTKLASYAALISQERITRRQGFRHGEIVYIKVYPDEYVSNYWQAWVLLAAKGRVLVQGLKGFKGSFLKSSILNAEQFEKKKSALKSRRRLVDPRLKSYTTWRPKIEHKSITEYIPPTIDAMPKELKIPKSREMFVRGKKC